MIRENEHLIIDGDWSEPRVKAKFLECPAMERIARGDGGVTMPVGEKEKPCRVYICEKGKQPVREAKPKVTAEPEPVARPVAVGSRK